MADDLVKAEVHAVRELKRAVIRYAGQIRDAAAHARREVAAADRKAQEAVERRRSRLQRAEQDLRQAQAALAQCRENCGGLQQAVSAARQRRAEAKQQFDRARKAAQLTSSAQSDLLRELQAIEAVVGEHASVVSSALANLDRKLSELPHLDRGAAVDRAVDRVVGVVGVTAQVLVSTMGVSREIGDISQGAVPAADHITTISEMQDRQTERDHELWQEMELESRKRGCSDESGETTA